MFECRGDGQFVDVARSIGCDAVEDGRGVAVADLNQDGKLDLVINNNNSAPAIYVNQLRNTGNWLRLRAIGGDRNRDALGTRVQVSVRHDGQLRTINRWVEAGSGYASQSEFTLHFGLGNATQVEAIQIQWPNGQKQTFQRDQLVGVINQSIQVRQGTDKLFPVSEIARR